MRTRIELCLLVQANSLPLEPPGNPPISSLSLPLTSEIWNSTDFNVSVLISKVKTINGMFDTVHLRIEGAEQ